MKILAISMWFPYPPDNGARMRTRHILGHLASEHTVDLVSLYQNESDRDSFGEAREVFRRVEAFPEPQFEPKGRHRWSGFLSPTPRYFLAHHCEEMARVIAEWTRAESYDAVYAVSLGAAPYAARLDVPVKVMDCHNVESSVTRRRWRETRSLAGKLRYLPTCAKCGWFEKSVSSAFDLLLVVSEDDAVSMKRLVGEDRGGRVRLVPNGCDPALLEYRGPGRDPRLLAFTGALTYDANLDAATRLCSSVLPIVRRSVPDARVRITGRHDGVDISGLAAIPGVELTGYVDDIWAIVSHASALITPFRYGGGTRLKILEAMALGTPVVSTPMGAEGIRASDGVHILLGDSDERLAEQTVRVLTDPSLAARVSQGGRSLVRREYLWDSIVKSVDAMMTHAHDNVGRRMARAR